MLLTKFLRPFLGYVLVDLWVDLGQTDDLSVHRVHLSRPLRLQPPLHFKTSSPVTGKRAEERKGLKRANRGRLSQSDQSVSLL